MKARWPATGGASAGDGAGQRAGNKVGPAPCNSLAVTWAQTSAAHPLELRRFDALRAWEDRGRDRQRRPVHLPAQPDTGTGQGKTRQNRGLASCRSPVLFCLPLARLPVLSRCFLIEHRHNRRGLCQNFKFGLTFFLGRSILILAIELITLIPSNLRRNDYEPHPVLSQPGAG